MCGIAGIYRFRQGRTVEPAELEAMVACIGHRGPDDDGFLCEGPVGLAHRRLTILDTSRRGRQPMYTADGTAAIVYNGEVYNFVEQKAELLARGHAFKTTTDTEVILALYRERGEGMLPELNGMFALALWDEREKTLLLARDRLGIKPLYYTLTEEGIVFASEIKAILAVLGGKPTVNMAMLDAYMSVGYVPTEQTLFSGILKLQPGCSLTVRGGQVAVRQWWDLDMSAPPSDLSEEECVREATALLKDSVRLQMRSDVPLGVFLSGGVDSSAVVALMHDMGIADIETFTVAYDFGAAYDETAYARKVASTFRTRHHEIFVTPREFQDFIPELIWHMDEPVTEAAATSLFFVSRLAREKVVVVLSGEGSDEVFGGYPIYKYMQTLERYRRLPEPLRHLINPVLNLGGDKWRKYTDLSDRPLEERYLGVSFYERSVKEALYEPELVRRMNGHRLPALLREYYDKTAGQDVLRRMMYLDVKSWLPDDLLIKADKMTMACSIELRVPFLDHRLVEFGARIPPPLRIKGWTTKHVLKKAMEAYLPREIIYRGKMGFPTPLAQMFKGDLREYVAEVLGSESFRSRGYFRQDVVQTLLTEHAAGAKDHHRVLWQLLVLEEWHRRFID